MVVLVTCKNDPIKSTREGYSLVRGQIWLKFNPIQAVMHVLVACKNEEDPIKHEGSGVFITFLPL